MSLPMATRLELDIDHQSLRHRLHRLEGTSEFWNIDFVVQAHTGHQRVRGAAADCQ